MSILVTGYNGFVGKNLIYCLKKKKIKIYTFGRENSLNELEKLVNKSKIIIHLAGENRNNNINKFLQNNLDLTRTLVKYIKKKNKKTHLIFSSTSQINKKKNIYSKTKLLAEKYLIKNTNKLFSVKIYRFTNIFGKWSKPNYNSVIATFCYNISRNKKIKLSKHNEKLKFIHIDHVIDLLINDLKSKKSGCQIVEEFKDSEEIYLYDLAKKIKIFYKNRKDILNNFELASGFDKLLYSTYLSFIPHSQFKYNVNFISDNRGSFYEFLKSKRNGQLSLLIVKPNQVRGNHYHMTKVEKFLILSGKCKFVFENLISKKRKIISADAKNRCIVETIPGWAHNIKNIGKKDLIVLLWANEIYDKNIPDTVGYPIN